MHSARAPERTNVKDELRARLFEQQEPGHECTPYTGGCGMPHYRYNLTLPNWLEQWPNYSEGREQADSARAERDWGAEDD